MEELLVRCGLNDTEAMVLATIVQNGPLRGSSIARRAGIKRPTVYTALSSLERLQLVSSSKDKGVSIFRAAPASRLPAILKERAQKNFDSVAQASSFLSEELRRMTDRPPAESGGLEVKTLKGIDAVYRWLVDNLSREGYDSIFNPQVAFVGPLKEAAKDFLLNMRGKAHPIREIAVQGPLAKWWKRQIENPNHFVKEIDIPAGIPTDLSLCNGTVCMVNYERHEESAILIRHPGYFASTKALFEALWSRL